MELTLFLLTFIYDNVFQHLKNKDPSVHCLAIRTAKHAMYIQILRFYKYCVCSC